MARLTKGNRSKPWKAECKIQYRPWFLGYYATENEAVVAEREFRLEMRGSAEPKRHPQSTKWDLGRF